ncbi:hypothetical protein J41TS12_47970 [Paenibacillus antibioticophila]|uniref:Uncharacterized protein n=1 Tax=Paenibacillus antibioticophila TaxID=1274374 RepID=A0A919XV98_9BACL|nr:hypothetical protein J41TS12_47970 [Paenibacillus antibioticophila]
MEDEDELAASAVRGATAVTPLPAIRLTASSMLRILRFIYEVSLPESINLLYYNRNDRVHGIEWSGRKFLPPSIGIR